MFKQKRSILVGMAFRTYRFLRTSQARTSLLLMWVVTGHTGKRVLPQPMTLVEDELCKHIVMARGTTGGAVIDMLEARW